MDDDYFIFSCIQFPQVKTNTVNFHRLPLESERNCNNLHVTEHLQRKRLKRIIYEHKRPRRNILILTLFLD